jgi:hypothetical protein
MSGELSKCKVIAHYNQVPLVPAKAGTQFAFWIPACAGMSGTNPRLR